MKIKCKVNQSLSVVLLTIALVTSGCVLLKSRGYDGTWSGTTSQGEYISFAVENNAIASITVVAKIEGHYCTGVFGHSTISMKPSQIIGDTFSVTTGTSDYESYVISGVFGSKTSASGILDFTSYRCSDKGNATWNATKE